MNKVSTVVIIGIVCVVLLGVLVYLNRDHFHSTTAAVAATEESKAE